MTSDDTTLGELRRAIQNVLAAESPLEQVHRLTDREALCNEALWAKAAELGWLALALPEEHGGLDLGFAGLAILYEELGHALASLPVLPTLLAAEAIASLGDDAQRAAWLPRLAGGELPAALLPADATPGLTLAGDGTLSGASAPILDGAAATLLVLPARTADGAVRYVLVEPGDGLAVETLRTVDRTRHLAIVRASALPVPPARVLAGDGAALAERQRGHACLALACDAVGGMRAAFAMTIEYLKTRRQFGQPIGSFQGLKHRCAEHKVAIEAAAAVVQDAVALWQAGDPQAPLEAEVAKLQATRAFSTVASDSVQLHGGIGFTWEHHCHLYLKRAKLNQMLFGSPEATADRAAELLGARA